MAPIYVVVVDSDPRFLEIATQFLQKRDGVLACSAVSTGDEIIRQARVFEPDVILYNLGTSDPTSLETISELRAMYPNLSIVVFAPPECEKYRQETIAAGATDFISRHTISLSLLPAIWKLVTLYQRRYGIKHGKPDLEPVIMSLATQGVDQPCLAC